MERELLPGPEWKAERASTMLLPTHWTKLMSRFR
jgi:hypothetical protein